MLSAVEGLETAAPALEPYVVPLSVVVLVGLFLLQSRGTARVGAAVRAGDAGSGSRSWPCSGSARSSSNPGVLAALDPLYAVGLFGTPAGRPSWRWAPIVLAVTGAEALYADMGHFGRAPIRLAWLGLVLPGLVLNYFGQGALLLRDPAAVEHPFYQLAPELAAVAAGRARHPGDRDRLARR